MCKEARDRKYFKLTRNNSELGGDVGNGGGGDDRVTMLALVLVRIMVVNLLLLLTRKRWHYRG